MKKNNKMKIQKYLLKAFLVSAVLLFVTSLFFSTDYYELFLEGNTITDVFYRGNTKTEGRIVESNNMLLYIGIAAIIAWVFAKAFLFDRFRLGVYTLSSSVVVGLGLVVVSVIGFLNIFSLKSDYLALNISQYEKYTSSISSNPDKTIEYLSESTWAMNLSLFAYGILAMVTIALLTIFVINFLDDRKEVK